MAILSLPNRSFHSHKLELRQALRSFVVESNLFQHLFPAVSLRMGYNHFSGRRHIIEFPSRWFAVSYVTNCSSQLGQTLFEHDSTLHLHAKFCALLISEGDHRMPSDMAPATVRLVSTPRAQIGDLGKF